jgi:TRAP-type C4-dicarboxylate transport system permease small subunit
MTEEISRTLLLWIGMLGAALAYRTGQHLGLDIVTAKFSLRWQRRVAMVLTALVVLFAFVVMVIGGGALVQLTLQLKQMSAALGVPVGWLYSVIPLSGGLISFYGLCQLYCLWRDVPLQQCSGCE